MKIKDLPIEIQELLPAYLANRQVEYKKLKDLLTSRNLNEINKIGHKLAGNAGSYGLTQLGLIGEKLENATNLSDINQLLDQYLATLERYEKVIS